MQKLRAIKQPLPGDWDKMTESEKAIYKERLRIRVRDEQRDDSAYVTKQAIFASNAARKLKDELQHKPIPANEVTDTTHELLERLKELEEVIKEYCEHYDDKGISIALGIQVQLTTALKGQDMQHPATEQNAPKIAAAISAARTQINLLFHHNDT